MDKLEQIMAWKRRQLADRIRPVSERELSRLGSQERAGPGLRESLERPDGLAVIAEIKRRSPSAGEIAPQVNAAEQARIYYNAGADALSILTDEKFFAGNIRDLWEAADLLKGREDAPPILRKDFFIHPIQVVEAAEAGARAILIIVKALSDDEIDILFEAAGLAGLECLFEVHNESELERAIRAGAQIIGVNNRDLTTFETDLARSELLIPLIPREILPISESGISTTEDAARARDAGARAVLVGEALMTTSEPEKLIKAFHSV